MLVKVDTKEKICYNRLTAAKSEIDFGALPLPTLGIIQHLGYNVNPYFPDERYLTIPRRFAILTMGRPQATPKEKLSTGYPQFLKSYPQLFHRLINRISTDLSTSRTGHSFRTVPHSPCNGAMAAHYSYHNSGI